MKKTAPTEVGGCMVEGGQEAILEILVYSSGYDTGCVILKLTAEGGKVTATEVYFSRDMQNHYTTSIRVGDYLCGFSGNQPGILVAMELKTGKVAWKDRSVDKGNCVFAENLLYCQGESMGIASARALSRMSRWEPGLRWLCGDEEINHTTLCQFRVQDQERLNKLFVQILTVLENERLVDLKVVAQDGTKVRARAGKQSMHRRQTVEREYEGVRPASEWTDWRQR